MLTNLISVYTQKLDIKIGKPLPPNFSLHHEKTENHLNSFTYLMHFLNSEHIGRWCNITILKDNNSHSQKELIR